MLLAADWLENWKPLAGIAIAIIIALAQAGEAIRKQREKGKPPQPPGPDLPRSRASQREPQPAPASPVDLSPLPPPAARDESTQHPLPLPPTREQIPPPIVQYPTPTRSRKPAAARRPAKVALPPDTPVARPAPRAEESTWSQPDDFRGRATDDAAHSRPATAPPRPRLPRELADALRTRRNLRMTLIAAEILASPLALRELQNPEERSPLLR